LSDALQQERNAEHYEDELVACAQKMFESLALVQLSFPPNASLDQEITRVESMLTRTDDVLPRESLEQRVAWAEAPDVAEQIVARAKRNLPAVKTAVQPVTNLLVYLATEIRENSR
jgi:hypothetical protein